MRHRYAAAIATAAALLTLTACSSSDDDNDKPSTTNDTAAAAADEKPLTDAVRAYTRSLFAGDADTAYPILSARCQQQISAADYEGMAASAKDTYGALAIKTVSVDQMAGDMARVSYTVGVPALDRTAQPWAREAGTWRWDAC